MDLEKATQTQLNNIQTKIGKSLSEIYSTISTSGHEKHGQIRDFAKNHFSIGHGDANAIANHYLKSKTAGTQSEDPLDEIYAGPKATLRPIHEALMTKIEGFGEFDRQLVDFM